MRVNGNIDPKLLKKAIELGHHRSQSDAINTALNQYIRMQRRRQVAELFGTIDFDPDWNPRAIRGKPPCPKS
jgi:hypothetical protein